MKLFIWGPIGSRETLSFILRRPYGISFEPGILRGFITGANFPDILFKTSPDHFEIVGEVTHDLTAGDFFKLDTYHDLDGSTHKRTLEPVRVMREGKLQDIWCHVYTAGGS